MLPCVDICGLSVTRLILGANPFAGFSHQNPERDRDMRSYYTAERIIETFKRAEKAGINTLITNNETEHVVQAVDTYLSSGGQLQWIAQLSMRKIRNMFKAVDRAVNMGAQAVYFHGALIDEAYLKRNRDTVKAWFDYARSRNVPAGAAGHSPEAHLWIDSLGVADFHAVSFFNCGSLHEGEGDTFRLEDMKPAVEAVGMIRKPCIAYKIMGAGRIEPHMAFDYAFRNIKPGDAVNVGMHRGDNDNIVEENVSIVKEIIQ